ncbi:LacI family DNA-binding transcriptional regulator [Yoonia sp. 208BN28-4]|uniref:LacI family DNA-binding transcriptional regulator n=1 Tax=Yoonia sp. 208BN28-4 TaxID=3126505 RepID=UPI0030ABCC88
MKRFGSKTVATLKDISAELGLSVATVSRALNGFPEVNVRTRNRVQAVADRLGYRPNRIAQRLVTGRSGMVGMIVKIKADMSADETFFEILTGLTAALADHDTDLVLAVDQENDPTAAYAKLLERDILDGFILNAPERNDPRVNYLLGRGIPFVMHGQDRDQPTYPTYGIDNKAVSAQAVKLLVNLGHRRIALINGEMGSAFAADRMSGFQDAMKARGLVADLIRNDAALQSHAYSHALDLLATAGPTAFVCASTVIAAGVMQAVKDRGLSVPRDVSVVAHDDAPPLTRARNFEPALTVTRAPLRDACEPLANMMIAHLKGTPAKDLQVWQNAEMILRGSTGPAPAERN